jgi:hypothetical protein
LLLVLFVTDTEFEFALLGAEHDRLTVHAADHIERRLGFAAQRQLQQVILDAGFDGLAQRRLDFEETVRRAKSFDALVRPLVIVIADPDFDPLARRLETVELGTGQELLPDAFPEPLDLAQCHRMLRTAFEMRHAILFQLRFEAAGAAPAGVLAAIIGEHFLGRLKLSGRHAVNFDDRLRRGAAEQIRSHHKPGIIIQEGNQVSVTAAQPKREDIRLPHLIGRGPLEKTRAGHIALLRRRGVRHQLGLMQMLTHRLRAGR